MKRRLFLSLIALGLSAISCRTGGLQPREGFVDVEGGRIWYRIVGGGTRTPLLLLHGGPGSPSYYLDPLDRLADERPVIFYDQLGSGKSDHPANPALWRTERFVDELGRLRAALGVNEVHVLGHSWGLKELSLPVLFTAGRFDEATPRSVEYYRSLVPGARLQVFERSGHLTMHDEPEAYVQAIRAFLRQVERQ